ARTRVHRNRRGRPLPPRAAGPLPRVRSAGDRLQRELVHLLRHRQRRGLARDAGLLRRAHRHGRRRGGGRGHRALPRLGHLRRRPVLRGAGDPPGHHGPDLRPARPARRAAARGGRGPLRRRGRRVHAEGADPRQRARGARAARHDPRGL
ncbi:MAG: 4-hydroxybenzoyl-CoA thioesterase family active site, partial [uncultured Solirubrobacteraceae bacterium]